MLLYFVLWTIIGALGQLFMGTWYGFKISKIMNKYGLDKRFCDSTYIFHMMTAFYKVIPLSRLGVRLAVNRSKLVIPIGTLNNLFGWLIWPVLLPLMANEMNKCLQFLEGYGRIRNNIE